MERPRYRDSARTALRDAVLDAARSLTIDRGWEAVRMADVAASVGVSRQTVYNEFRHKDGLAEALARREVDRFLVGVREALLAAEEWPRALRAGIGHALAAATADPLIKAIVTGHRRGSGDLLPYLTTRSELVLRAAAGTLGDWARQRLPGLPEPDLATLADAVVRLVVSHIISPSGPPDRAADAVAEVALR
ncbi:MAG TPA: TetR family transcriptional regulator, partial [Micromonosporaceae bacterium]